MRPSMYYVHNNKCKQEHINGEAPDLSVCGRNIHVHVHVYLHTFVTEASYSTQ